MGLPGVKVGPMDPDRTSEFGVIGHGNTARQLIRAHAQMFPAGLQRASVRPLDPERTKALDLDEVRGYVEGLELENGDAVLPEGAQVVGAAVRGERDQPQVLVFTYRIKGGRTGKWYAEYTSKALPNSFKDGSDRVRVSELRERGIVSLEQNAGVSASQSGEDPAVAELRRTVTRLERDLEARDRELENARVNDPRGGGGEPGVAESTAGDEPPVANFDSLKANEVVKLLKADDTTDEQRQAILDFEKAHANRKGVVSAAEQSLGARGAP